MTERTRLWLLALLLAVCATVQGAFVAALWRRPACACKRAEPLAKVEPVVVRVVIERPKEEVKPVPAKEEPPPWSPWQLVPESTR